MREVEMLREELQQLRAQLQEQPQNPPAQESIRSNIGRKPEPFRGTKAEKDSFRIKHWLDRMDTYWRTSGVTQDPNKIDFMRGFLMDDAGTEYDTRISECGPFDTYKDLKDWLTAHYSTADSINTYRDRFFNCHQRDGESFDDYFKRFREARGTLDTPLPETYIVYFFVRNLLPQYRLQIRGDKDFSDYKDITLDDVLGKLKRMNPTIIPFVNCRPSNAQTEPQNDSSHRSKKRKGDYHQQWSQPQPQPGQQTTGSPAKLTDGQKNFIESQIRRGGGPNQFFEPVQNNPAWQARARQANLCYKCASPHHHGRTCNVPPAANLRNGNKPTGGAINAIIPDEEFDFLNDQQQA